MGVKVKLLLVILILYACTSTEKYRIVEDKNSLLVEYAVAYCLSKSYPGTDYSLDATYVAGSYLQKGDSGLDKYFEKNYISKQGKNLVIMKCIDLFNKKQTIEEI